MPTNLSSPLQKKTYKPSTALPVPVSCMVVTLTSISISMTARRQAMNGRDLRHIAAHSLAYALLSCATSVYQTEPRWHANEKSRQIHQNYLTS